jgi:hypothetical protein
VTGFGRREFSVIAETIGSGGLRMFSAVIGREDGPSFSRAT